MTASTLRINLTSFGSVHQRLDSSGQHCPQVGLVQRKLKFFHGEDAECPVKITGAHSFGSLIKAWLRTSPR